MNEIGPIPKFFVPKSDEVVIHEEVIEAKNEFEEQGKTFERIDNILRKNGIID